MLDTLFTSPLLFLVWSTALLLAITVHEFAHAYMADKLGDPTPRMQGRLTLNPVAHLDPLGTLMLLLVRFGWGKPVQFDPYNLKNPKRDAAIISLAGPVSNILLATVFSIIARITPFGAVLLPFISLNLLLAVFNLLPIHPLDGGKILVGILPDEDSYEVDKFLRRYGTLILLMLLLPWGGRSPIFTILSPILNFLYSIFLPGNVNFT